MYIYTRSWLTTGKKLYYNYYTNCNKYNGTITVKLLPLRLKQGVQFSTLIMYTLVRHTFWMIFSWSKKSFLYFVTVCKLSHDALDLSRIFYLISDQISLYVLHNSFKFHKLIFSGYLTKGHTVSTSILMNVWETCFPHFYIKFYNITDFDSVDVL